MKKNQTIRRIKVLFTMLFIVLFSNTILSQENRCKAKLSVIDGKDYKKINALGTFFRLSLVNLDNKSVEYSIGVNELPFNKSNNNTDLMVYFLNVKKERQKLKASSVKQSGNHYKVKLKENEIFNFIVELIVPKKGVEIGDKSITEIRVTSKDYNDFTIHKELYAEIIKVHNK